MADLLELETFVAVARSGSFAAAARLLAISPAMIGRRIQALEQRYGTTLIERTTRSQRLTASGQAFLSKSAEILDSVEELGELARPDIAKLSGRIRVAGPTTLGIKRLAGAIAEVSEAHPALTIELHLGDANVDLVAEGFDLAVRIGNLASTSMIARRVGTYDFVCCATPNYIKRFGAPETPSELGEARCILNLNLVPRNQWPFRDKHDSLFSIEVRSSIEIDNGEAQRAAALTGAGIIYAPRNLVEDDLRTGALVQVLKSFKTLLLPIHTLQPSRRFVPQRVKVLSAKFAEILRDPVSSKRR
jgi:DNA-binding transcriptional LysR family regulator